MRAPTTRAAAAPRQHHGNRNSFVAAGQRSTQPRPSRVSLTLMRSFRSLPFACCRRRARQGVHRHRAPLRRCAPRRLRACALARRSAQLCAMPSYARVTLMPFLPPLGLQASCWRRCWSAARTQSATRAPSSSRHVWPRACVCAHNAACACMHCSDTHRHALPPAAQILEGVAYLHDKHITHRDLKARLPDACTHPCTHPCMHRTRTYFSRAH